MAGPPGAEPGAPEEGFFGGFYDFLRVLSFFFQGYFKGFWGFWGFRF